MNRDVIVVGASAGSLDVLFELVGELPADLPASLFVVVHTVADRVSPLPELLSRRSALPALHPLHEQKIELGHIYVAPPDNHLLLRNGTMQVVRGPKENGHRPAADALFRTASAAYGPRVVGVVLSGYQDCGTAGMMSIQARGGLCVVQEPESAEVSEMPRNVIARVPEVDHIVHPRELPALLVRLSREPAGQPSQPSLAIHQLEGHKSGSPAELVCPICSGVLTVAEVGSFQQFRCHVGHTFSLSALVSEQNEEMERALWAAVRSLEESSALSQRLSLTERGDMRARFAEKARTQAHQADLIRGILLHSASLMRSDTTHDQDRPSDPEA